MADEKKPVAGAGPLALQNVDWKAAGVGVAVFLVLAFAFINLPNFLGTSAAPTATPAPEATVEATPEPTAEPTVEATPEPEELATPTALVRYCQPGSVPEGACGEAGTTAEGKYCIPGQRRLVCDCNACPATTGPCASLCQAA